MPKQAFPHFFDPTDQAFHATFPEFAAGATGDLELMNYDLDPGVSAVPNQDMSDGRFSPPLPPLPFGCMAETSTSICGDEDKAIYDPQYTHENSCLMEGHGFNQGANLRTSFGSLTIYGLRKDGETHAQAEARKRGKPFFIDKVPGRDWFDSFRLAMRGNKRSIGVVTPWFQEWAIGYIPKDTGLFPDFYYDGVPAHYSWHATKVSGEETVNGEPTLIVTPWQGSDFGKNGKGRWTRARFNKVFDNYGTIAGTPGQVTGDRDVVYIKATLLQQVLIYLNMIIALFGAQKKIYA